MSSRDLNFFYAAHTYVDEWIAANRQAKEVLEFRAGLSPDTEAARKQVVALAIRYGIMRNLSVVPAQ